MTFALTLLHLKDRMKESGCPICHMAHDAAEQSIASFLWENVNDPVVRQSIFASYGFCPKHAQLLVAKELLESATVLGVNILYEHLGRSVAQEIKSVRQKEKIVGGVRNLLRRFSGENGNRSSTVFLPPSDICPICATSHKAALNSLSDLFEELEKQTVDIRQAYLDFGRHMPEAPAPGDPALWRKAPSGSRFSPGRFLWSADPPIGAYEGIYPQDQLGI